MATLCINEHTKLSVLIKANPMVIETLAEFNPCFSKLRNPLLRKLLTRRTSILDACRIGRCKTHEFLDKMSGLGFEIENVAISEGAEVSSCSQMPDFIIGRSIVDLDVRPIIARGDDPLKLILDTCKDLKPLECLKVTNTFEPVPLIRMLGDQGFQSWTARQDADLVINWFVKNGSKSDQIDASKDSVELSPEAEFQRLLQSYSSERIHTVDVRELAMPLPMITILDHLQKLLPGEALFVYHKKLPVFLLPELRERGYRYSIKTSSEGSLQMLISN